MRCRNDVAVEVEPAVSAVHRNRVIALRFAVAKRLTRVRAPPVEPLERLAPFVFLGSPEHRSGTCIWCREARSTGCTSGRFRPPPARTIRARSSRTSTTTRKIGCGNAPGAVPGPGRRHGRTRCCTSLRPSRATWSRRSARMRRSAASWAARSTSRGRKARQFGFHAWEDSEARLLALIGEYRAAKILP